MQVIDLGNKVDMSDTLDLTPSSTAPKKSYEGNCHCGAVRYTANIASLDTQQVTRCNCSICTRNGYLLVYTSPKDVVFHQGYDDLKGYRFASKKAEHKFCPTCGSSMLVVFNDGKNDTLVLNVRSVVHSRPIVVGLMRN